MHDLVSLSATELCALIRERKVSAVEAMDFFEQRHDAHNPTVNAIVATDFAAARERAREADAALARGEYWGPLHGLPMTIKDNIETAHLPTAYGVEGYRDYIAPANADVTQLVLDAGAIIFGKTNIPSFGTDTQTFNDAFGQTNNPWDLERTPGGSSGGAAAALAAGLTPLEIGSDIGGSIRIPAHFCGVYGHKSSYGAVSLQGPKPWEKQHHAYPLDVDLLVCGPLARSARDLSLAMDVITGPAASQRGAVRIELPPSRAESLKEFRVGVWLDEPGYSPDPATSSVLQAAVDAVGNAGAQIVEARPDVSLQRSHEMRNELEATTLSYTCPPDIYKWALEQAPQDSGKRSALTYAESVTMRYHDWHKINRERLIMRQRWHEYFRNVDVLLCPVARVNAHPHDHTPIAERSIEFGGKKTRYWPIIGPWNAPSLVSYLPATAAPVGYTADGLPVDIQIIGPYLEDRTTMRFAELLESLFGTFELPPAFKD